MVIGITAKVNYHIQKRKGVIRMIEENPFHKKQTIEGRVVAVLEKKYEKRDITLISQFSRAVLKNEIHEIMITDEVVSSDDEVNRIWILGFFEVTMPGIVVEGDQFKVGNRLIGTVCGFNDCHMPNHLNIVIHSDNPQTGIEMGVEVQEKLTFG